MIIFFIFSQGAGVLSVYLFMKRYAEEEMYRPHPAIYRPRLSESSDYSGQYLHPESSWPPPKRGRSTSEASSDISIQLNQTLPKQPKSTLQAGARVSPPSASSSPGSYQMHPQSAGYPSTQTLPRSLSSHPQGQALPMTIPPSPIPPPHYHTHMRMSASPC